MITESELMHKLYELPEHFNRHMKNREYAEAKHCYDKAVTLCVFLNVPEKIKMELFGNRAYIDPEYEDIKDGLFREEDVQKAYWECIKTEEERLMKVKLDILRRAKK